ncbi:MAG: hypothetical protein FJX75_15195 [Armatimonadetes bacterium]|nr:hypothetical protein [Armatimonadota bacterium]
MGILVWDTQGLSAGAYHIHVDCWDAAGNHQWHPCFAYDLKADPDPPAAALVSFSPTPHGWAGGKVRLDVACADALSGVERAEVSVRLQNEGNDYPGPWWHRIGAFDGSAATVRWDTQGLAPGRYHIHIDCWDRAGNHQWRPCFLYDLDADSDPPAESRLGFSQNPFGWAGAQIDLDVGCTDAASGVARAELWVRRNDTGNDYPGPWWTKIGTFDGSAGQIRWDTKGLSSGLYHLHVDCWDDVGNHQWRPCFLYELRTDVQSPEPSTVAFSPGSPGWAGGKVQIQVSCSDGGSGVERAEVWLRREDQGNEYPGPWWRRVGEFLGPSGTVIWDASADAPGSYHIHVDCWDKAGNHGWQPCFGYELRADAEPPLPSELAFSPAPSGWAGGKVELRATCIDTLSGVARGEVWVRNDGEGNEYPGPWWHRVGDFAGAAGTVYWDTSGLIPAKYHVHVDCWDNAGNHQWRPCFEYELSADARPPDPSSLAFTPDAPQPVGTKVLLTAACSDDHTGIARTQLWVRREDEGNDYPGPWWSKLAEFAGPPEPVPWEAAGLAPGVYHFHVDCWDGAGNHQWHPCFRYELTPKGRQPDLLISRAGGLPPIGDGVFEKVPMTQVVKCTRQPSRSAVYYLCLQNDGNVADGLRVLGSPGNSTWKVRYYEAAQTKTDITAGVTGLGWLSSRLQPGSYVHLLAVVTPKPSALAGTSYPIAVTATSATSQARTDAVRLVTRCANVRSDALTSGPLTVTALSAAPTPVGAQVSFSLSSAATVEARVLNLAGRPVKVLCQGKAFDAGTNTLLWNAQSETGLAVPSGTYLIEVAVRGADGSQSRALATVRVAR